MPYNNILHYKDENYDNLHICVYCSGTASIENPTTVRVYGPNDEWQHWNPKKKQGCFGNNQNIDPITGEPAVPITDWITCDSCQKEVRMFEAMDSWIIDEQGKNKCLGCQGKFKKNINLSIKCKH